jgi:periplasmic protein TonB
VEIRTSIYADKDPLRKQMTWSVVLHGALIASIALYTWILGNLHSEDWGGTVSGSGVINATLISSAAIPLPRNDVQTENILANESTGVAQSAPKQPEQTPDAVALPDRSVKIKPPKPTSVQHSKITPPKSNVVPFGQGGPTAANYTMMNMGGSQGGIQVGGGDFGSRYSWYVDAVRRKVSDNWHKYEVDPGISNARRVYLTFDILRNGEPTNVELSQSSGVPSLDISAVRALQRIDTFGPLPNGYSGNKVSVEFWFEYKK